jgi:hypothetical protein
LDQRDGFWSQDAPRGVLANARILGQTARVHNEIRDDPWELALGWVAVIAVTLLTSAIAFLVTGARCGAIGVALSRSAYCRAVNAPALAPTPIGIALEFVVFGLPSVVAATAAFRWVVTRRRPYLTAVSVYCAANVALSLVLLGLAHGQYAPVD